MLNQPPQKDSLDAGKYDPRKRDPQYAHAGSSPLWELVNPSFGLLVDFKF